MNTVHLSLITLANTLFIKTKGGKTYNFSYVQCIWNAFTIYGLGLVVNLCTLGSGGTTWMQTDPHPLVLKPASVSEILACLISIHLTNSLFLWKRCLHWYLKSPAGILKWVWADWINKFPMFPLLPESWVGFLYLPFLPNKLIMLDVHLHNNC